MSSPCKRLKLAEKDTYSPRLTQETRITSTPQHSSDSNEKVTSPSPDVSSISSRGTIRTRLSDVFEADENPLNESALSRTSTERLSKANESSLSYSTDHDYNTLLNNLNKIKYTGLIWQLHKPLTEDTLYANVLEDPFHIQEIVLKLFLKYRINSEAVINKIIKFCLDVSGFQTISISQIEKKPPKEIIALVESDEMINAQKTLKSTGRYIFMEHNRAHLTKVLKASIYIFLQKLICTAHEQGILYDNFFSKRLFPFIKCMSFTNLRAVQQTGVTFATKILTALVTNFNKIINEIKTHDRQQQKSTIQDMIQYFYLIFMRNCSLQDNKIVLMRVECIHELRIWINHFPKNFITELQAIDYLMKLIVDGSRQVRYAALCSCQYFIETPTIMEFLTPYMGDLMEAVGKRFYDVDPYVAIKAINIFTSIAKVNKSFITSRHYKLITTLVFDNYFSIGEAACAFIGTDLLSDGEDLKVILKNLATLTILFPEEYRKDLLIEGALNTIPAIRNWNSYIELLLNEELDFNMLEAIAELLAKSVFQTLRGKSATLREGSIESRVTEDLEHLNIAKLLPMFNLVLNKYVDYPSILVQILKSIILIDNNLLNGSFCNHYTNLCGIIQILFTNHSDESLLHKLVETLEHLHTFLDFSERAIRFGNHLCNIFSDQLLSFLEYPSDENTDVALKVAIIYSHFNLNDRFTWENLFDSWNEVNKTTTKDLLICCKWYLIWNLKTVTETTQKKQQAELTNQCNILMRMCNEFTISCFNILQRVDEEDLHLTIYQCLCDFYNTYTMHLEKPLRSNKQFESIRLKIEDVQFQVLLVNCLEKYAICNEKMNINDRQENVVRYVNLAHNNVMPIESLACIFQYYYKYNAEYGLIIEASLTDMTNSDDENTILLMVVFTLTFMYEKMYKKHNTVNANSDEAKYLRLLIKQFLLFKFFRTPKKQFRKMLQFSINYSFKDESKYAFLYFLKYFINLVTDADDRREVFEYFKKKTPKDAEKHDAILYFAQHIKSTDPSKSKKKSVGSTLHTTGPEKKQPQPIAGIVVKDKKVTNKEKATENQPPKATIKKKVKQIAYGTQRSRQGASNARKTSGKKKVIDSETEDTGDDLTIHDSESDDIDETLSGLRI